MALPLRWLNKFNRSSSSTATTRPKATALMFFWGHVDARAVARPFKRPACFFQNVDGRPCGHSPSSILGSLRAKILDHMVRANIWTPVMKLGTALQGHIVFDHERWDQTSLHSQEAQHHICARFVGYWSTRHCRTLKHWRKWHYTCRYESSDEWSCPLGVFLAGTLYHWR